MKRRLQGVIYLVLALSAGLIVGGCGDDPPSRGMVDGYVYSVEGRQTSELVISRSATPATGQTPVPDARVTITGSSQADFTNDQGYFKIGRVLPGTQTLTVSKPNYTTVTIEVRVVKGQTTHVSQFDRQWTLLIYLNADNNLETDGVDDVNEMEQVGSTEEVAIVVLMDRIRGTYPDDVSNGNWTDTRRFVVQKDDDTERMTSSEPASGAEILGEFDMGDPGTLKEFIEWGLANYPAEHYLLDIWNHGAGWRSRTQVAEATRGVSFDDTDGTSIETVELPFALNVNPLIDVTAFDSSLMQMMEVAYEIRNRTDLVVGSEESPPGEGYPYEAWIGPLVDNPDLTPRDLARLIVNQTIETMGDRFALTQSAVDTSQLGGLSQALDGFARALIPREAQYRSALTRARNNAQHYGSDSAYTTYKDLLDYANQVAQETNDNVLKDERFKVETALNQALVAERHTGSSLADSHGLSIYVPPASDWSNTQRRYRNLAFAKDTQWDEWIDAYTDAP